MKNLKNLFVKDNGEMTILFLALIGIVFLALCAGALALGFAVRFGYIQLPFSIWRVPQFLVVAFLVVQSLNLLASERSRAWWAGSELRRRESRLGT